MTITLTGVVSGALGLVGIHSLALTTILVYIIDAVLVLLGLVMPVVTFLIYLLRKFIGFIQRRLGPMRVGPYGVFQSFADALKLLQKEDLTPENADRAVFAIAPYLVFVPAVLVYVVIPFGLGNGLITKDLNVGLVYITAITSVSVVGIIAAGWASNNKWSLLGGLRSAAQLVAYELPMTLGLLGPALMAGSLALGDVVEAQRHMWFVIPQALGFLVYFTAALAEVSHIPFDLPEAESELVAGYNVEYSGMRFGLFFLGEFANTFTICAVAVALFFGGWRLWPGWDPVENAPLWLAGVCTVLTFLAFFGFWWWIGQRAAGWTSATDWTWRGASWALIVAALAFVLSWVGFASVVVFLTKTAILVFILIWLRGTLPRVRIDQLMGFAWKVLVPLGLLNFLVITFQVTTGIPTAWVLNGAFILAVIAVLVWGWKKQWAYSNASNSI